MPFPVSINLLAIPDGLDSSGNLRITVQVSPIVLQTRDQRPPIELSSWPLEVSRLAKAMVVEILENGALRDTIDCSSSLDDYFDRHAGAANALWNRVFNPSPGFAELLIALDGSAPPPETIPPMACAHVRDLSLVWRALTEVPSEAFHAGPQAIQAVKIRRSQLLRTWLGPIAKSGLTAQLQQELQEARLQAPTWQERSAQVSSLLEGIRGHIAGDARSMNKNHWATLRQVLGNLLHRLSLDEPMDPVLTPAPGEPTESATDKARRRLLSLQSIPSLAHYVSLAIQLRIPAKSLNAMHEGEMRVSFKEATRQQCSKTAFEYVPRGKLEPAGYFGPRSEPDNDKVAPYLLRRGKLLLSEDKSTAARFALETVDAVNSVFRLIQSPALNGNDEATDLTPESLRRGIVLLDGRKKEHDVQQLADDAKEAAGGFDANRVFYAQDLLIGFRPDVALAPLEFDPNTLLVQEDRWRPLTVRQVRIEELDKSGFYKLDAIREIAHHDHSYTVSPIWYKNNGVDPETDDDLFSWAGSSLAVAAEARATVDADEVLGIDILYELGSPEPAELMAPLRETRGYVVACRATYLNGAGPSFTATRHHYSSDEDILIGAALGGPLVFPASNVQACSLHLPVDDPLASEEDLSRFASESLTRLIVRDSGREGDQGMRRRIVLPARTDFDSAELEGQFDTSEQKKLGTPLGMCPKTSNLPLLSFAEGGEFPEARAGKIWYRLDAPAGKAERPLINLENDAPFQGSPEPVLRGTVVLFRTHKKSSPTQYYASKHGRQVQPRFEFTTAGAADPPLNPPPVAFWKGDDPSYAMPAVLELRTGQSNDVKQGRCSLAGGVKVPCLQVTLAPAATARLTLDKDRPGDPSADADRKQVIELVHAVAKPLREPAVKRTTPAQTTAAMPLGIHAVTIRVDDYDSEHPNKSWKNYVAAQEKSQTPMLSWPSEGGGSVTHFVGGLVIDRASTGQVSLSLAWDDFDETRVVRDPAVRTAAAVHDGKKRWKVHSKPMSALAFDTKVEEFGASDGMSLLRMELPKGALTLRNLSFAFTDGRARQLKPTLRATSRFVNCYPAGGPEAHVRESTDLEPIWTQCTFRPPPPRIETVKTSLQWSSAKEKNVSPRLVSRSNNVLHIHLHEGWYASGEGEQLGVLLKPAGLPDADIPESHRPFISRFARDPVRNSIQSHGGYLTANDVVCDVAPVDNVAIPISNPGDKIELLDAGTVAPHFVRLQLIRLTPETDEETGGLVCKLELRDMDRHAPMLHLGLVRYQHHAVKDLEASTPVPEPVRLQPNRLLTVTAGKPGVAGAEGRYYRTFTVATVDQHAGSAVDRVMDLRLMQRVEQDKRWEQYTSRDEAWPILNKVLPKASSYSESFKLPRGGDVPKPNFGMILEEYEVFPSDAEIKVASNERILLFSVFIPLGKHGGLTW